MVKNSRGNDSKLKDLCNQCYNAVGDDTREYNAVQHEASKLKGNRYEHFLSNCGIDCDVARGYLGLSI